MTNYPPNILDSDDFDAMTIKELLAIGRYINTTKNGENDLVEEDFFDALITRLSDVSEELELEQSGRRHTDEARESNEDEEEINNFIEEFSAQADVMGGDLGASMHEAIGIIERLRATRDPEDEDNKDFGRYPPMGDDDVRAFEADMAKWAQNRPYKK